MLLDNTIQAWYLLWNILGWFRRTIFSHFCFEVSILVISPLFREWCRNRSKYFYLVVSSQDDFHWFPRVMKKTRHEWLKGWVFLSSASLISQQLALKHLRPIVWNPTVRPQALVFSSSPTLLWKCIFLLMSHRWSLWFSASLFQQKLAPLIDTAVHRPLSVSLPSWTSLECRARSSAIKWSFQILVYQLESRKGWFLLLSSLVEFGFSKWASRVCVSLWVVSDSLQPHGL